MAAARAVQLPTPAQNSPHKGSKASLYEGGGLNLIFVLQLYFLFSISPSPKFHILFCSPQKPFFYSFFSIVKTVAVASWPGVIEPGSTISDIVHMVDWFPTFLTLAGGKFNEGL